MKKENLENILILIGNLAIFFTLIYVVFILGYSGWWMALIFVIGFRTTTKHE